MAETRQRKGLSVVAQVRCNAQQLAEKVFDHVHARFNVPVIGNQREVETGALTDEILQCLELPGGYWRVRALDAEHQVDLLQEVNVRFAREIGKLSVMRSDGYDEEA